MHGQPEIDSPTIEASSGSPASGQNAPAGERWWIDDLTSFEGVQQLGAGARRAAIDRFNQALEDARAVHAESQGLFVYRKEDGAWAWGRIEGVLPSRAVLLVHGLDEAGAIWDDAAPAIAEGGFSVIRFDYPNDQPIAHSCDALAGAMSDLRRAGVERVDLVCHSMGGLVARDLLTRGEYYAGDASARGNFPGVTRLILIGTPNLGAPLAPLRGAMEIRDQFVRWLSNPGVDLASMLGFMVDGQGEAGADLTPGSAFLTDLNAREAPSGVEITTIVGELGVSSREAVQGAIRSDVASWVLSADESKAYAERAASLWAEVGDGAVPASSARLKEADELVVLDADHRSMIRRLIPVSKARALLGLSTPPPPAIGVILERLTKDSPADHTTFAPKAE